VVTVTPGSGDEQHRPDRIEIRDLRVLGIHGALPEERGRAQPFSVDLDIVADLGPAGASDDLADTIDYGALAEAAAAEVAGPAAALLEHLADRIAARVLELSGARARSVTVTLRKLRPPVPVDVSSIGVRITRP
jgi:dihydroneopterin aldolase